MIDTMLVRGAKVHNLKNIDVEKLFLADPCNAFRLARGSTLLRDGA